LRGEQAAGPAVQLHGEHVGVTSAEHEDLMSKINKGYKIGTTTKIKLADKLNALEKLAKMTGLYAESEGRALANSAISLEMFRQMIADADTPKTIGSGTTIEQFRQEP